MVNYLVKFKLFIHIGEFYNFKHPLVYAFSNYQELEVRLSPLT